MISSLVIKSIPQLTLLLEIRSLNRFAIHKKEKPQEKWIAVLGVK